MRPFDTRITIEERSIILRPSIGAALRLLKLHSDMEAVFRGIVEGNITIIRILLEATAISPDAGATFDHLVSEMSLAKLLEGIAEPLMGHVIALCGADEKSEARAPSTDRFDWAANYKQMWGTATSILGWSPEDAWDACPWELHFALQKRTEIVRVMNGGKAADVAFTPHTEREPDAGEKLRRASAPIGSRVVR